MSDILHLIGLVPRSRVDADKEISNFRKNRRRNIRHPYQIMNNERINPDSLSHDEWEMIYDLEDEYVRRGNFFRK